jgi:galactokinase
VSCKELDVVVDIARGIGLKGGVIGCRMTGGGFGGCTVALVKTDAVDAISQKLAAEYTKQTGIRPTMFVSRPGQGASILKS